MTTARQFIESFLQEETAAGASARVRLSAVYGEYFGEPMSYYTDRFLPTDKVPVVEEVEQSDRTARVAVRVCLHKSDIRRYYRLAASGASWKIVGLDTECLVCSVTGQSETSRCTKCDGKGWYVIFPEA
jgi:hypothetical protein